LIDPRKCRRKQQENKEEDNYFFSNSVHVVYSGAFISILLTTVI